MSLTSKMYKHFVLCKSCYDVFLFLKSFHLHFIGLKGVIYQLQNNKKKEINKRKSESSSQFYLPEATTINSFHSIFI